jgi:hypothetical protein
LLLTQPGKKRLTLFLSFFPGHCFYYSSFILFLASSLDRDATEPPFPPRNELGVDWTWSAGWRGREGGSVEGAAAHNDDPKKEDNNELTRASYEILSDRIGFISFFFLIV